MSDILVEKDINNATYTLPYVTHGTRGLKYVSHTHAELEIFKCDRGKVKIVLKDRDLSLRAGDIAVFMPGDIHNIVAEDDAQTSCIKFYPSSLDDYNYMRTFRLRDVMVTPYRAREAIVHEFDTIIREDISRGPMYTTAICGAVQRICLILMREADTISLSNDEKTKLAKYSDMLSSIDEYIKIHFSEDITLSALANHVNMSKYYLCRVFSEVTGMGFVEYLTKFRLIRSVEMMSDESLSLVDIALRSGFTDVKCYIRSFKRYYTETPGKYRKNLLK